MKLLAAGYREVSMVFWANMDRFLVPLLIIAALFLAGNLISYATVH